MELTTLDGEALQRSIRVFGDRLGQRTLTGNDKIVGSLRYREWHKRQINFKTKPSDVWVVSYAKVGTTWLTEIVWCILNNLDFETAKNKLLTNRVPFFEWDCLIDGHDDALGEIDEEDPCKLGATWKTLHIMEEQRIIKSHLHYELLPADIQDVKPKIIYICRDPRDVCVSYYFHSKKLVNYIGDFDTFVNIFLDDLHFFSPFWKHILDFWQRRHDDNILFLRYEELQEDICDNIKKVSKFLNVSMDDSSVIKLANHASFDNMKQNRAVNNESLPSVSDSECQKIPFIRKGKVGDWKNFLNEDQIRRFKEWTEQKLSGTDFPFYRDY